jgi:hypothetical protein
MMVMPTKKKCPENVIENVWNLSMWFRIKMLAITVILRHSVVCNRLQPIYIKKQKL